MVSMIQEIAEFEMDPVFGDVQAQYRDIVECLLHVEKDLFEISEALKHERECIALFDLERLKQAVLVKEELLEQFHARYAARIEHLSSLWQMAGHDAAAMPGELTEMLLVVDVDHEPLRELFRGFASRLRVLRDVLTEQQEINKRLVLRSLSWIDSYIGDIVGTNGGGVYNRRGRLQATGASRSVYDRLI